jgi:phospholipid/cholesterol/gamma-HCH transport system substrate-binding protein
MRWQAELKVGILVVVAVILFAILLTMASDWNVGIPGREITFTFDRLNNLKKGAAVHLAGVHVGKVTRIELLEDGNGARVTAQINAPVTLRDGVTAELGSLGMIGEAYISLVNGPAARPEFDWTTPIHGTAGTELSALIAKVDAALNQTTEVVALAKELLATTQEELRETAKALRQATGDTTRGLDTFVAKMDPVLTRTARLVDVLERRLPPLLTSAEGVVANADKQVSAIGNDAHGLAADAKSWLAETQTDTTRLMDDVRDVVEESRQTLSTLTDEAKRLRADLSQVAIRTNETIGDEKTRLNETLSRLDAGVEQAKALVKRLDAVTAKIESGDGTLATLIAKQDTLVPRVEAVLDETTTAFQRFNAITEPVQQLTAPENPPLANLAYELTYRQTVEGLQSELGVVLRPDARRGLLASITSREGQRLYNVVASEQLGSFVGRVGFIESQGALGVDWNAHRNLTLRAEAVGISRRLFRDDETTLPRFDAKVIVRPFPMAHFVFGAENIGEKKAAVLFGVRTNY